MSNLNRRADDKKSCSICNGTGQWIMPADKSNLETQHPCNHCNGTGFAAIRGHGMSLSRELGFRTTPAMRARIRELAGSGATDDYDRAVLTLLDDFARAMVLIGALSEASKAGSVNSQT